MSSKRDQDILAWILVESDIRSLPLCRDGLRLSTADVRRCAQAYTLYGLLLVDLDLVDGHSSRRIIRRLAKLDVLTVVESLKQCDGLLLEHFRSAHHHVNLDCFKHSLATVPPLQHLLLEKVSDLLNGASIGLFRCLHQLFSFLSRLTLDGVSDAPDIDAWIENNYRLGCFDIDYSIVEACRPIVTEWLAGISIPSVGRHGSGTVHEWSMRRRIALSDKVNDPSGDLYHGYSAEMHRALAIAGVQSATDYLPPDFYVNSDHERLYAVSRLISVPKNAIKRRIIAPETLSQQYFQQQLMIGLYRHIDRFLPWIPLRDQSKNRQLAKEGSISGYYSTVDLSAASDSVSVALVQRMFRDTSILPLMEACRSRHTIVVVDGTEYTIPMSMYATMGSAICFPLECIVFSALCEYTARVIGHKQKYSVYGDDIVFPSQHVDVLIQHLRQCGFIVNDDKSFTSADPLLFRESCGGEYLRGEDVTPLRISRRLRPLENKRTQPATFEAYIEMANTCLDKGLLNMRSYLIKQLFSSKPYPIFGYGDGRLHPIGVATNYRLPHRWNTKLQRHECRAAVVVSEEESTTLTPALIDRLYTGLYGECELWNWHRQRELDDWLGVLPGQVDILTKRRSVPTRLRTKVDWVCSLY